MAFRDGGDDLDGQPPNHQTTVVDRAKVLFLVRQALAHQRIDRAICWVMVGLWLSSLLLAGLVSPRVWELSASTSASESASFGGNPFLKQAFWVGLFLSGSTIGLLIIEGALLARYWTTCALMLWSSFWIYLWGGRLESHFCVFASLWLVSRYCDSRLVLVALGMAILDHLGRGFWWPESLFGVKRIDGVRVIEHMIWMSLATIFLTFSSRRSVVELWNSSLQHIQIEQAKAEIDRAVLQKTHQLGEFMRQLEDADAQLRKQTEDFKTQTQELEAARSKAEQSNIAKTMFLTNMSHEIRTPMTAILGFSEALEEQIDPVKYPESVEFLEAIRRNSEHLLQILNDILDLSRIEAGKFDVERVPFCPGEIVEEVVAPMYTRASAKGLHLKTKIDHNVPSVVIGDPARLRQVLINLVGNAVKFTEQGRIEIYVETIVDKTNQKHLRFTILDTGIGLSPEQTQRLFQPFTQGDLSTTRRYGGAGLGLAISKRLAELMGGTIDVQSAPSQGCLFIVLLPLVVPRKAGRRRVSI